jgi:hypothetical protein
MVDRRPAPKQQKVSPPPPRQPDPNLKGYLERANKQAPRTSETTVKPDRRP